MPAGKANNGVNYAQVSRDHVANVTERIIIFVKIRSCN